MNRGGGWRQIGAVLRCDVRVHVVLRRAAWRVAPRVEALPAEEALALFWPEEAK